MAKIFFIGNTDNIRENFFSCGFDLKIVKAPYDKLYDDMEEFSPDIVILDSDTENSQIILKQLISKKR